MGFSSLCPEIWKAGEAEPVRCAQSEPPREQSFCQCLHFPLPFCFSSNPPVVLLAALVSLNIIFSAVDGLLKYEVHKSLDNVTSTAVSVLFSLSDRPARHGGSAGPGEQCPRATKSGCLLHGTLPLSREEHPGWVCWKTSAGLSCLHAGPQRLLRLAGKLSC